MNKGDKVFLTADIRSNSKATIIYGRKGDEVEITFVSGETFVVMNSKGEKFSVGKTSVSPTADIVAPEVKPVAPVIVEKEPILFDEPEIFRRAAPPPVQKKKAAVSTKPVATARVIMPLPPREKIEWDEPEIFLHRKPAAMAPVQRAPRTQGSAKPAKEVKEPKAPKKVKLKKKVPAPKPVQTALF